MLENDEPQSGSTSSAEGPADKDWEQLLVAIADAGGFVSPKLKRCPTKNAEVLGIFAVEAIDEEEVLVSIPQDLAMSAEAMSREMPELYNAAIKCCSESHDAESMGVATCIANLFGRASEAPASHGAACTSTQADEVWMHAARILRRLDFSDHPLLRCAGDVDGVRQHLAPSPELPELISTVRDVSTQYALISEALGPEVLPSHFSLEVFWQAFASLRTRRFANSKGSRMLIPVIDLFNHSPDAGCTVSLASEATDRETRCDALVADCAHNPGDEVTICYKSGIANPLLFHAYGFTLPPEVEPTCSFSLQVVIEDSTLFPSGLGELNLRMDIGKLDATLVDALKRCHSCGQDARKFLADLCRNCREQYESDPLLQPALAALTRLRMLEPSSGAWWTCMPGSSSEIQGLAQAPEYNGTVAELISWEQEVGKWRVRLHTGKQARLLPQNLTTSEVSSADSVNLKSGQAVDHAIDVWKEHCVRVKMSEYLCLTAYIETAQLALGQLHEQKCLETGVKVMLMSVFQSLGTP